MADPAKNILIGLFVIAACFLIVGVLLFLHPTVGDCRKSVVVRFTDIDKINTGTRVTFAGRAIGEVLSIRQLPDPRKGKVDQFDRVYAYELRLCIDSSITVYDTDKVSTFTSGLLGERSVGIIPQVPPEGVIPRALTADDIIYSESSGSVEDALARIGEIGEQAERALRVVADILEDNRGTINDTLASAKQTFKELHQVIDEINDSDVVVRVRDAASSFSETMDGMNEQFVELERQEVWLKMGEILANISDITDGLNDSAKWQEIVANLHSLSEGLSNLEGRVSSTWDRVDDGVDKFADTMENVVAASTNAREIMGDVKDGKGSIGRILSSDEFYLRLNTMMGKADTLMNDINHYGLLFHRERGWQRERTKRMTQAKQIETADEFRAFFTEEIDRINTSLARVHVMMGEAESWERCDDYLLDDERFACVFRDLLLQIRGLQDSIELYNQDLVESGYDQCR